MRLWWRKPEPSTDDLDEARQAKEQIEHAVEQGHKRWEEVRKIVRDSRRIRRVNHLADDLRTIFGG